MSILMKCDTFSGVTQFMFVLDFLRGTSDAAAANDTVGFEYRVLCSGELYNARAIASGVNGDCPSTPSVEGWRLA